MAYSFVEVLLDLVPNEAVHGIYMKGSGLKEWDTPIDYVPEISDVDIHIQFYDDADWPGYLGTLDRAIEVNPRSREGVPVQNIGAVALSQAAADGREQAGAAD